MRARPIAILVWLFLCAGAPAQGTRESHVVGTWKYDIKTVRFTTDPQLAEKMRTDPKIAKGAKPILERQKKAIVDMIAPLRIRFNKGGTASITSTKDKVTTVARWSMKGNQILMKLNRGEPGPSMELSKDAKIIKVSFFGAGFGTMVADLVRV